LIVNTPHSKWAWRFTPVILALRRLRQDDLEYEIQGQPELHKFQANLDYTVRPWTTW
jgi:hypothetical protein